MTVLRIVAATGCGLVAGLLFAFSAGVMAALGRLPGRDGAAAMRAINAAVLNPVFLGMFVGTGLACAALVVGVAVTGGSALPVLGAALYLAGVLGVTAAVNVPLNDALAAGAVDWDRYRARWTRWNHVRTLAGTAGLVLLLLG
ncbi:DUF1772 domain-containing protein [Pseudonocardia petroleophila]|nr:anthrone oxygenase family protein [Pseudonocardia petroleophila]